MPSAPSSAERAHPRHGLVALCQFEGQGRLDGEQASSASVIFTHDHIAAATGLCSSAVCIDHGEQNAPVKSLNR